MRKIVLFFAVAAFASIAAFAEEKRYTVPVGDSPSLGPENAPVTIIEFIDFQ